MPSPAQQQSFRLTLPPNYTNTHVSSSRIPELGSTSKYEDVSRIRANLLGKTASHYKEYPPVIAAEPSYHNPIQLSHTRPPETAATQQGFEQSPYSQIANAMLMHRQLPPLRQPTTQATTHASSYWQQPSQEQPDFRYPQIQPHTPLRQGR